MMALFGENMTETYLTKAMIPQEATFVNKSVDAYDATFTCILPHRDISSISQDWLFWRVYGYH